MLNFEYYNPTRIVFGKGQIAKIRELIPPSKKILMTYGGGSIKQNGVYDQVKNALQGHKVIEFAGIEANPVYETLMKAVKICRDEKIDFLLAVGGGSIADGTKFIAAAVKYKGEDPWDILKSGAEIGDVLPVGCVLTLSATGSEMNAYAVVSRNNPPAKLSFGSPKVYPVFSVLDPETLFTLPERQILNGIVDPFVHVNEQYLTRDVNSPLQDAQACAVLRTLIDIGPKALKEPKNYELRANLMWCATQALNGVISCGVVEDWSTHMIGHELTNSFGLDHAQTLAVIHPAILKHQAENKLSKLKNYAENVWGINTGSEMEKANKAIQKTEGFFRSLGVKTKLREYNISSKDYPMIAERVMAVMKTPFGENKNIGYEQILEILKIAE